MVGCIMGGGDDKEKVLSAGPDSPALISERKFLISQGARHVENNLSFA